MLPIGLASEPQLPAWTISSVMGLFAFEIVCKHSYQVVWGFKGLLGSTWSCVKFCCYQSVKCRSVLNI